MNEAENLEKLFNDLKEKNGTGRAAFARANKLRNGKQLNTTLITQHLRGDRPISMDYAYAYASGFGLALQEVSPSNYEKAYQGGDEKPVNKQANQDVEVYQIDKIKDYAKIVDELTVKQKRRLDQTLAYLVNLPEENQESVLNTVKLFYEAETKYQSMRRLRDRASDEIKGKIHGADGKKKAKVTDIHKR